MTKPTVPTERLKQIRHSIWATENANADICRPSYDEVISILDELLAVREAQSVPVGFRSRLGEHGTWHFNGWRDPDAAEKEHCQIEMLYTAPPAPAVPAELLDAMAEVIRISDRDHEAWDRAKAAISACQPDGEKCWSCGKYFTYAQHSECDGYCPHCNAPVDLDDEDQPSPAVPPIMKGITPYCQGWNECRAAMLNGGKS